MSKRNLNKKEIASIMLGCIYDVYPINTPGGQQAGLIIRGVSISHPDYIDTEIRIREFRSQMENKDKCTELFELFLLSL